MSIFSLVLYGSCARDDQEEGSDVDVFAVCDDLSYGMVVQNKVNVAKYPVQLALDRAASGDLFLLHVVCEGRVIYDSDGCFASIVNSFAYKSSYVNEIENAVDVGLFLRAIYKKIDNYLLYNRALAWCVRTILIAKSAEERTPVFSAKSLSIFSDSPEVYDIVKNKNNFSLDSKIYKKFDAFVGRFSPGISERMVMDFSDIDKVRGYFLARNNMYGLKLLRSISSKGNGGDYF